MSAAEMREAAADRAERRGFATLAAEIRAIPLPDEEGMVERVAQTLHFDFCEQLGWPNGQPTWDEMPDETTIRRAADTLAKDYWRTQARAAIRAINGGEP